MKAKLIKVDKGYYNLEDKKGNVLGTSYQFNSSVGDVLKYKLSKQNCDEIFGVVDVEKLAIDEVGQKLGGTVYNTHEIATFLKGFNKAMELNRDKVFTEKQIKLAIEIAWGNNDFTKIEIIKSLEITEIDVEIEMERQPKSTSSPSSCGTYYSSCGNGVNFMKTPCDYENDCEHGQPKLDPEECLILYKLNY